MNKFPVLNRYPGAKRRRRRNSGEERGTMQWYYTRNFPWNRAVFTRMREPSSLGSASFADSSSLVSHARSPATISIITDIDDERISSAVSVKKVSPAEIAKMDPLQKPMSKKNPHPKPLDNDKNSSISSQPTVKIVRVKKVPHMDETDESNKNNIPLEDLSSRSKQSDGVPVTRIHGGQSNKQRPRPRASSAGSVSVIHVNRSSREVQSRVNRSKISRTGSAVTVKRVPRRVVTAQSNQP